MKSRVTRSPKKNQSNAKENKPTKKKAKSGSGKATEANNYIIPPGLFWTLKYFEAHFKVAGNQPIMIVGPTGVGKSVFSHIYWKLCGSKQKIISENCAYFGDKNSDPLIARAELFGYKKGSHQLADVDKAGLIEKAEGGVLFLDEIGMLPKSVQGQLYRFMETGEYRPLGALESIEANVRVVGATNEEGELLEPFRFRFLPFYIPPLYERRQDILYYINAKYPELIPTLTSEEIMILLAYNWPGNVREVNHVANLLRRHKMVIDDVGEKLEWLDHDDLIDIDEVLVNRLCISDKRYFDFSIFQPCDVIEWAASWGGDKFLLSQMHELGFSPEKDNDLPFDVSDKDVDSNKINFTSNPEFDDDMRELSERLGVKILQKIKAFDQAYRCYTTFCGLIGKRHTENENIMADIEKGRIRNFRWHRSDVDNIRRLKSKGYGKIPDDLIDYISLFENRKNPRKPQSPPKEHKFIDVTGKTQKEVLIEYNKYLLIKTGNNKRKAADLAGVIYQTFLSQLNKRGLSGSSEQKNKKKNAK